MAHRNDLHTKPNVIGTCCGPRRKNGQKTDEECIIALVREKVPESELSNIETVDKEVTDGGKVYPTDVQEVGNVCLQRQTKHRPAPGGVSIGSGVVGAGTMGSGLLDRDGDKVVLTNAHVAGEKGEVLQPAYMDSSSEAERIGTVLEKTEPDPSGVNYSDSALIAVDDVSDISDEVLGLGEMGELSNLADFDTDTFVKSGRTTGVTEGGLRGRDARISVRDSDGNSLYYVGCDIFDAMSQPGDSGSLIGHVEDDVFYPCDLLFAGSSTITVAIPLDTVQRVHGEMEPAGYDPEPDENPLVILLRLIRELANTICGCEYDISEIKHTGEKKQNEQ